MSSIQQYQQDIQKYYVLREKISKIIVALNQSANSISRSDQIIKSNYKVNGNSALITNRTTNLKKSLEQTSNYLSSTILSGIDSSVENARRQIAYLEEQERIRQEEERIRQEEAERARQEAAHTA